jgi:hypothetical protein
VGADETGMQAYATLAGRGVLKQRVRGCIGYRAGMYGAGEKSQPDCIKMVLDGAPTDCHTAAMVEPYACSGLVSVLK